MQQVLKDIRTGAYIDSDDEIEAQGSDRSYFSDSSEEESYRLKKKDKFAKLRQDKAAKGSLEQQIKQLEMDAEELKQ